MKICSPQLGLSPNSYLGGEVHDFNLIDSLCNKGVLVEVILPKNKPYLKNKNLTVEYLPLGSICPPHLFNLIAFPYIYKKYKEGFDILRFHNPYFLGFAGKLIKKLHPEIKIVTTIHLKETRVDLDFILRQSIFIYDHIFTASEYLKSWIVENYHYPENKVSVIYNGIEKYLKPITKDNELVRKYSLEDKIVLLNVGSLIERKNIFFLLDVFENLTKQFDNLKLIYCGKGDLEGKLKSEIAKRRLESKVIVSKPLYKKEKNKIFNLADIFLFPSKNEGFGLVGVEAMKCAKPVVASNNTSLPEIVEDGVTGYLAETSNLEEWVSKIAKIITDNNLRDKMGQNGRKKAEEFTWIKVAEKTMKVYRSITG